MALPTLTYQKKKGGIIIEERVEIFAHPFQSQSQQAYFTAATRPSILRPRYFQNSFGTPIHVDFGTFLS